MIILVRSLYYIAIMLAVRSFMNSPSWPAARYSLSNSRRHLNRILIEREECRFDSEGNVQVTLLNNDTRSLHIRNILKLSVGDTLRCGVIDIGINDFAEILSLNHSKMDTGITLLLKKTHFTNLNNAPTVDLILAVPRPLRLERLLPVVSCMGIGRLILVGGSKVEKDYFGSHMLRYPSELRKGLVEGLAQAEVDCRVPTVSVFKSLENFLSSDCDMMFPTDSYSKVISHPLLLTPSPTGAVLPNPIRFSEFDSWGRGRGVGGSNKRGTSGTSGTMMKSASQDDRCHGLSKSPRSAECDDQEEMGGTCTSVASEKKNGESGHQDVNGQQRIVVAVGPEGGWTDQEILGFVEKGFTLVHMGSRILRTDIAVPALLALAHEWVATARMEPET